MIREKTFIIESSNDFIESEEKERSQKKMNRKTWKNVRQSCSSSKDSDIQNEDSIENLLQMSSSLMEGIELLDSKDSQDEILYREEQSMCRLIQAAEQGSSFAISEIKHRFENGNKGVTYNNVSDVLFIMTASQNEIEGKNMARKIRHRITNNYHLHLLLSKENFQEKLIFESASEFVNGYIPKMDRILLQEDPFPTLSDRYLCFRNSYIYSCLVVLTCILFSILTFLLYRNYFPFFNFRQILNYLFLPFLIERPFINFALERRFNLWIQIWKSISKESNTTKYYLLWKNRISLTTNIIIITFIVIINYKLEDQFPIVSIGIISLSLLSSPFSSLHVLSILIYYFNDEYLLPFDFFYYYSGLFYLPLFIPFLILLFYHSHQILSLCLSIIAYLPVKDLWLLIILLLATFLSFRNKIHRIVIVFTLAIHLFRLLYKPSSEFAMLENPIAWSEFEDMCSENKILCLDPILIRDNIEIVTSQLSRTSHPYNDLLTYLSPFSLYVNDKFHVNFDFKRQEMLDIIHCNLSFRIGVEYKGIFAQSMEETIYFMDLQEVKLCHDIHKGSTAEIMAHAVYQNNHLMYKSIHVFPDH